MTDQAAAATTNAAIRAEMARHNVRQASLAEAIGISQAQVSARLSGRLDWKLSEIRAVAALLGVPLSTLVADEPAREAGHAAARLLGAVALAFVLAAGLPIHAGVTLLVALFVGWLWFGLFGAEVSTWGVPARVRHLTQRGRRDRTADR